VRCRGEAGHLNSDCGGDIDSACECLVAWLLGDWFGLASKGGLIECGAPGHDYPVGRRKSAGGNNDMVAELEVVYWHGSGEGASFCAAWIGFP